MGADRHVDVATRVDGVDVVVGRAFFNGHGARLSTTFTYSDAWLSHPGAWALDPDHPLSARTGSMRACLAFWPTAHRTDGAGGSSSARRGLTPTPRARHA